MGQLVMGEQSTQDELSRLQSVQKVALELASSESFDLLLHRAVKRIGEMLAVEGIVIFVSGGNFLRIGASMPEADIVTGRANKTDSDAVSGAWWMGLPFVGDVADMPDSAICGILGRLGFRRFTGVPLTLRGQLVAVIVVMGDLSESQNRTLITLAQSLAPIFYGSRTIDKLQNDRFEMDIFQQIDHELTETIKLNHVFEMMLDWALRFTNANAASIALVDGDNLRFMSNYGYAASDHVLQRERARLATGITYRVARTGTPEIISDLSTQDDRGIGYILTGGQSQLAVPVIREDVVVAVITLESRKRNGFTNAHLDFTRKLGERAGYAIDNARLYNETEYERQRLSTILENVADVVIVVDMEGSLRMISQSAISALRLYPHMNYTGKPFVDVVTSHALSEFYQQLAADDENMQSEVILPNGRTYYVKAMRMPEIGHALVMQDITPFKEMDTLKNELIATVSHDLKQPLSVMRGYVDLIRMKSQLEQPSAGFLDKLEVAILNMRSLIDGLLDLAQIESVDHIAGDYVQLRSLLVTCIEISRSNANAKAIKLESDLPDDLPSVMGETLRLGQIFTNLISNAIKYTPPEGEVTIFAETREEDVRIGVRDSGLGISPEDQARIFDRFYRVRRPETDNIEGTGLGLAIVKKLVDIHGGQIRVESKLGHGSTFYVTLPVARQRVATTSLG